MQLNARSVEGKIDMLRLSGSRTAVLVVPAGGQQATDGHASDHNKANRRWSLLTPCLRIVVFDIYLRDKVTEQ